MISTHPATRKAAETNIKLSQIQEAIKQAAGNSQKEEWLLTRMTDPKDPEVCEACE